MSILWPESISNAAKCPDQMAFSGEKKQFGVLGEAFCLDSLHSFSHLDVQSELKCAAKHNAVTAKWLWFKL